MKSVVKDRGFSKGESGHSIVEQKFLSPPTNSPLHTRGTPKFLCAYACARVRLEVYTANHQQPTPNTAGFQLHIVVQKNQRPNPVPLIVNSPRRPSAVVIVVHYQVEVLLRQPRTSSLKPNLFILTLTRGHRYRGFRRLCRIDTICPGEGAYMNPDLPGKVLLLQKLTQIVAND